DTTAVVVCTDHGHYLGEHDLFGKPAAPIYSELGRIPLLVRWPGAAPRDVDALTTSVDLHATMADLFGASVGHPTHGRSLVPLIEERETAVRELALFGYWGGHVGLTDGRRRYLRGCGESNFPLSMWSNRWSTMPVAQLPDGGLPKPDLRAELRAMPGTSVPVIRQPFEPGDPLPFWAWGRPSRSFLFDVDEDPHEERSLIGSPAEVELADALAGELRRIQAPTEVLERIGLS
ncbi:MAG: sulfatase/phosphatase domain-containing protein, partial [Acidimicrobiales bacterium]